MPRKIFHLFTAVFFLLFNISSSFAQVFYSPVSLSPISAQSFFLVTDTETITGIYDRVITRSYESTAGVPGRASGFVTGSGNSVTYGYDAQGRLNSVDYTLNGVSGTAMYSYLSDSDLPETLATPDGRTTTLSYEPQRDLVTRVQNQFNSVTLSQYDYEYDALARRSSAANTGAAFGSAGFNRYDYNDRNELRESTRYLGTDVNDLTQPVGTQFRDYAYDPIGNRTSVTEGASAGNYSANNLNQYDQVDLPSGQTLSFTWDADGNLLSADGGGGLAYQGSWDAENRLVLIEPQSPSFGDVRVEFVYDYQGRRVGKITERYTGGIWDTTATQYYVYDGWNVIEEETDGVDSRYFVWGLDLSGSLQGAGGIGGLLAMVDGSNAYDYLYDANGNVGQLVNAVTGTIAAHYEYDPFGKTITSTGALASSNPYRFSTKYFDTEYDLYYYGHRYYDPQVGRWLSRDPVEEEDTLNLYAFTLNDAINGYDLLGLYTLRDARKAACSHCDNIGSIKAKSRCYGQCSANLTNKEVFDSWLKLEKADTQWLENIPACPDSVCIANGKPVNCDNGIWCDLKSDRFVRQFHPGADYCMRSIAFSGSAQQCCYSKNIERNRLFLIKNGEGAGTPDRVAATNLFGTTINFALDTGHIGHDVTPFNLAKTLKRISDYLSVRSPSQGGGACYGK